MGALAQLVTQVLTGHLTKGVVYDCVQAMVCFNSEGSALCAKAMISSSDARSLLLGCMQIRLASLLGLSIVG